MAGSSRPSFLGGKSVASFQEIEKGKYKLYVELGYRGKRRIRRTKTIEAKNDTEARKQLVMFEADLLSRHIVDQENITLEQFYPQWKDRFAVKHFGDRSLVDYCNIIDKRILPDFGTVRLKDITKLDIVTFIDDLKPLDDKKGQLAPSTIHNIFKAFNSLMQVAEDWELIDRNPCYRVKLPKLEYKKGQVLTVKETDQLFKALEGYPPTWQLIVQVAAITGARQGEIAALEGKHLDTHKNIITIEQALVNVAGKGLILKKTKTDKSRKVTVPKELMKSLSKLKLLKQTDLMEVQNMREWPDHLFLFSNEYGKPLRPDSISQWWSRFLEDNNKLKKIRFHDLRHTSATLLINEGIHAKIIQERLGHSNISTTMNTYGHVLEEADQTASKHFDRFFTPKKVTNE